MSAFKKLIERIEQQLEDGTLQLREVGWTDEARAASALARKAGYKMNKELTRSHRGVDYRGKSMGGHATYMHPKTGHWLDVKPNGSWEHSVRSWAAPTVTRGSGPASLGKRLSDLHPRVMAR